MTAPFCMPMRNERAAPTFDSSNPRELPRFFEDLESLMTRANLTAPGDMKKQVLKYVDIDTEQMWKTFPEYTSLTQTYDEFKKAILEQYPDATGDFIYSIRDMDLLIGERQRVGIATMQDLSNYHVQFMSITRWLIEKKYLAELEQERAYVRALQPQFLGLVMNRLAIKMADHHPNVPYKIKDVHEAARFILQGASLQDLPMAPPSSTNSRTNDNGYVKTETLASMMAEFTKTMNEALSHSRSNVRPFARNQQDSNECNYCGGMHYIRDCEKVEEDIKAGKCKKNQEGKVVLPNGFYVSRAMAGNFMRDRIFEWHRRNPSSQSTATLLNTIDSRLLGPPPSTTTTTTAAPTKTTYQLTSNDRIAVLEAELFNLRTRKQGADQGPRTRAQSARNVTLEEVEDEDDVAAARAQLRTPRIEEGDEPRISKSQPKEPQSAPVPARAPEHPFRNAKDAAYSPPGTRNIGAQDKTPAAPHKRPEAAYKTLPPVHDPVIATSVFQRSMEAPIMITQRELLSLSPEVRSQVRDSTTTRRIPNKDAITTQNLYMDDNDSDMELDSLTTTFPVTAYAVSDAYNRPIPQSAFVVSDPIESYYRSLGTNKDPDLNRLMVAGDSYSIRSVNALIDSSHRVECILDPGCQIIAMSESICHQLGLPYDPSIVLHMQSANGELDQSLGLSRNVPFQIGTITMYLQVHVISSPAYDVLLGRPFDVLTESVVRNFANEDQTITIQDPNTGRRVTVPTVPRTRKVPKCMHPRHREHSRLAYDSQGF
jgi:hypothetical protein